MKCGLKCGERISGTGMRSDARVSDSERRSLPVWYKNGVCGKRCANDELVVCGQGCGCGVYNQHLHKI